ncbi:MAG TPA: rhodanese-like domain-containing protein, partial [Niastella sp.]
TRLARVGYDNAIGFLEGGLAAWKKAGKEIDTITSVTADELATASEASQNINVLDVRKNTEYDAEHVKGAVNARLDYINDSMQLVDKNKTWYVHCAGGYRSMIFISILKARGFDNLIDVKGGFKAIKDSRKFSLTDYVCPSTML